MDGNGRWAERRGQPTVFGHKAGGKAVERTVEVALGLGVRTLTLHAFSSENWKRPTHETEALMRLFGEYLRDQTNRCKEAGVRISVVGRRDRLSPSLLRQIELAEDATEACTQLRLRLAIDYSAREALLEAARLLRLSVGDRMAFEQGISEAIHDPDPIPEVDLIIRTGGERRFSDLFGWDCSYAEVLFSDVMWPDFSPSDLEQALDDFRTRERRFGALTQASEAA